MWTPTVVEVRQAIASHRARSLCGIPAPRRAAVAAIVRDGARGAELLFIRRAEHPLDPWSGHMAFPGGRVDPGDRDALAAAVRETREELRLDLTRDGLLLGPLSDTRTHFRRGPVPLAVSPFVFELQGQPEMSPNHEVQEVVWVPLGFLLDRANRSTMVWRRGVVPIPLPCYRLDDRVIWGLTLRMVDELLELLGKAVKAER